MAERIALYGGCFDPIHIGHLITARSVAEALSLSRVVFLPSANPPHKNTADLLDARHRAEMVQLAIRDEALFAFSDHDLVQTGPTYAVDTVGHFSDTLGEDVELHWILGADSLAELATWHRVSDLVDACRVVTAARSGFDACGLEHLRPLLSDPQIERLARAVLETPHIDIAATDIRTRIQRGLSIHHLVPDCVHAYIQRNGLYRADAAGD